MKKVLVYGLKDPVGGVEKIIFEYASCMVNSGYDISFDFIIFSEKFSLESEINALGCRVVYLPSKKSDCVGYKKKLNELFANNDYCAVWGNYSGLTNIDLLTFAKKHNVPIRIAHSHVAKLYWGHPLIKIIGTVLHFINKIRLTNFATHYWACSELAGKFMFPQLAQSNISVINNAIDVKEFYPNKTKGEEIRKQFGISTNDIVVGHIARMCVAKNQVFLLKIMSEIRKINQSAKLLFVGEGELKDSILAAAKDLGLLNDIIFTGFRTDTPDLLRAMDVFVLPSLSEGLGLSIIEAQAVGIPCVASAEVPQAVNITDSVKFVSLDESPAKWAKEILAHTDVEVVSPTKKVIEGGFEINAQSQKIYLVFNGE